MNMIDLAGSERQRDTGAVGDRLKEAGGINKSLLVLSEVIKYLSKASTTTGNVPQNPSRGLLRSSTLTKLLSVRCVPHPTGRYHPVLIFIFS
jgi:hypothetical protein